MTVLMPLRVPCSTSSLLLLDPAGFAPCRLGDTRLIVRPSVNARVVLAASITLVVRPAAMAVVMDRQPCGVGGDLRGLLTGFTGARHHRPTERQGYGLLALARS
jgi:hypothetical protein